MSRNAPHPERDTATLWVLVPCAGKGSRAQLSGADADAPMPKQYHQVGDKPVVAHTLAAFAALRDISGIVLAVAADDVWWEKLLLPAADDRLMVVPCGGPSRAATVLAGLAALRKCGATDDDWILVHDAARCLLQGEDVERLISECRADAAGGLLALPLADTLKQAAADGDRAARTLPRQGLWQAQTPQMFRLGPLRAALEAASADVTDEASAMELAGFQPKLVHGNPYNIKLTYPQDFALARALLALRQQTQERDQEK